MAPYWAFKRVEERLLVRAVVAVADEHRPAAAVVLAMAGVENPKPMSASVKSQSTAEAKRPFVVMLAGLVTSSAKTLLPPAPSVPTSTVCQLAIGELHVGGLRRPVDVVLVHGVVVGVHQIDEIRIHALRDVGEQLIAARRGPERRGPMVVASNACSMPSLAPT